MQGPEKLTGARHAVHGPRTGQGFVAVHVHKSMQLVVETINHRQALLNHVFAAHGTSTQGLGCLGQ